MQIGGSAQKDWEERKKRLMTARNTLADGIVTGTLYSITKSKRSTLLNLAEFIPVIGDFVPAHTISLLLRMYSKSKQKQKQAIIH